MIRYILMTSCRTETANGESWIIRLLLQSSVSGVVVCLCQGSPWTFWAHFVVFLWFGILSLCLEFLNLEFDCFVYRKKCNSSETETFYQVWALRRWGGRQSQRLAVVS